MTDDSFPPFWRTIGTGAGIIGGIVAIAAIDQRLIAFGVLAALALMGAWLVGLLVWILIDDGRP